MEAIHPQVWLVRAPVRGPLRGREARSGAVPVRLLREAEMIVFREYFMPQSAEQVAAILRHRHCRCELKERSRRIKEEPYVEHSYLVLVAKEDRELAERILKAAYGAG